MFNILKKKSKLELQIEKRAKIIKNAKIEGDFNYFEIQDYIDLEKFSTYIFITPRGIGKTYSKHNLAVQWYNITGEYTTWIRTKDAELKEMLIDYKGDRPAAWPDWAKLKGNVLLDTREEFKDKIIIKFVALSTVHNLASIRGDGCGLTVWDEFLPRGGYPLKDEFKRLTDFIKTLERESLMTVILSANPTTANSQILTQFGLWVDELEIDDEERRLRYRYIKEWENPPKVMGKSTADIWAAQDSKMLEFMNNGEVLDGSEQMIQPYNKIEAKGEIRWYQNWTMLGVDMTWGCDAEGIDILVSGHKIQDFAYTFTTEDVLESKSDGVVPYSNKKTIDPVYQAQINNRLIFTDFIVRETFIKFVKTLYGNINRKDGRV